MKTATILSAAALTVSVLAFAAPAMAATANNMRTGAHTSNPYDSAETAYVKQQAQQQQQQQQQSSFAIFR